MKKFLLFLMFSLLLLNFYVESYMTSKKQNKSAKKVNKALKKSKLLKVKIAKKHKCGRIKARFCKKICKKKGGMFVCLRKAKISYRPKRHLGRIHFLVVSPLCVCRKLAHKFKFHSGKK